MATYPRIMIGLSMFDLFSSMGYSISTWPVPVVSSKLFGRYFTFIYDTTMYMKVA